VPLKFDDLGPPRWKGHLIGVVKRGVMPFSTESDRVEAFSDGVIAVIITIMVLELRPPQGTTLASLHAVLPTFAVYVLSFVFLGIYWNNHHHMLRAANGVDGRAMWANLHLLFWLSLVPFTTSWLGQHPGASIPTALYAFVLLFDAVAYTLLQRSLLAVSGCDSALALAVRAGAKENVSMLLYVAAVVLAFVLPLLSYAVFVIVALIWIVPDRRLERAMAQQRT
jgi:uncharacterized membrane protein